MRFRKLMGVLDTTLDLCMYGLESCDTDGVAHAKEPTRVLTNKETPFGSGATSRTGKSSSSLGELVQLKSIHGDFARRYGYRFHLIGARIKNPTPSGMVTSEGALSVEWAAVTDDGHVAGDQVVGVNCVEDVTGLTLGPQIVQAGR